VSVAVEEVEAGDPGFALVRDRAGARGADEPVAPASRPLVATRGGEPVARLATSLARGLTGAPGRSGLVGHYEAVEREAGVVLLRHACAALAEAGAVRVLGPMNGSTWGRYRLALPSDLDRDPPFAGEPVNPPEYLEDFRTAGFRSVAAYESAVVEDLAAGDRRAGGYARRLVASGGAVAPLDPASFDDELSALHGLTLGAFAGNPFFSPIGADEFRARYAPLRPLLDPELVRIARGADGTPLGFVLAYPDPGGGDGGSARVVLKTLATAPAARGMGLGTLLVDEVRRVARERGDASVIHALMHSGNASVRISRHSARVFRRYTLFGWEP
jgi:GNAT superfamily N-acetyltransferase